MSNFGLAHIKKELMSVDTNINYNFSFTSAP